MTVEQLGLLIDYLTDAMPNLLGPALEAHNPAAKSYPYYHVTQLRHMRQPLLARDLNGKLLARARLPVPSDDGQAPDAAERERA